jgi:hypothetical protein
MFVRWNEYMPTAQGQPTAAAAELDWQEQHPVLAISLIAYAMMTIAVGRQESLLPSLS